MDDNGIAFLEKEEEVSDSFTCCVCLDILYKPIVLYCGHISCFWCVHQSMSSVRDSTCPICRNPYNHFPTICQMLHFLIKKMYPLAYKRRESQVLADEKQMDCFSPQFEDASAPRSLPKQELNNSGSCTIEESSAKPEQLESTLQMKIASVTPEDDQMIEASSVKDTISSENQLGGTCEPITVEDVLCAGCNELLFRPVGLNCGHVYCESCVTVTQDEMIICDVCKCPHPKGLPKVSLELDRFLEERFPSEYASRKNTVQPKQVNCTTGTKVAAEDNSDNSTSEIRDYMGPNVHPGVGCDYCGVIPIVGDRYRCKDCVEAIGFDLCGTCFNTNSKHPGRFNQQHTSEHKFELTESTPYFDLIFSRIRVVRRNMENNMALLLGNSSDSEEAMVSRIRDNYLTNISSTPENLESDPSFGAEEHDQDDSHPAT